MTPTAHASFEVLAAYAAGTLSEGMSLLVASHLTFCPACRDRVRRLETIGGALLGTADPVPPAPGCLEAALARIEAAQPPAAGGCAIDAGFPMPLPLQERLGAQAERIRWRFLLPGLSEYRLEGFGAEEVSLMRARPGVRVPGHTHTGQEATLILTGRMRDGGRVYGPGDMSLKDARDDHHPEIDGDEICVCLIVLTGKMRFTGRLGRALNLFNR